MRIKLSLLLSLLPGVLSKPLPNHWRENCQTNPQTCPPGTIIVSNTNTTTLSQFPHFTTLQDAITSLPNDNTTQTILLLAGTYTEQINITRSAPITLLGETTREGLTDPSKNKVTLTWAQANHDNTGKSVDNVFSSVLVVAPTLESSLTGSGPTGYPVPEDTPFGNRDFRAYNVDFRNTWRQYSDGPAHALSFSRGNGGFYSCGFYSYQDTIYIGKLANTYIHNSIIAGQTDFLYGFGTLWIHSSSLQLRSCGGGITAWKGTNTTTPNTYGVYIVDSSVRAANASIAASIEGKCPLGRPWNELHRSIFANSYEDGSVLREGYVDWVVGGVGRAGERTLMAEYKNFGPGWDVQGRIDGGVGIVLGRREWERYSSPRKVFGDVDWIDWGVVRASS